jgi:Suppressor of fused protein (SUFU)
MLEICEDSPNGRMTAVVSQDSRSAWLCLFKLEDGNNPQQLLAMCWIRNLVPASTLDPTDELMPLMPEAFCAHPQGEPPLIEEDLEFVFFEEGNGVGLFERGDLLAVIPSWAQAPDDVSKNPSRGLSGYSRDCLARHIMAWPLEPAAKELLKRLSAAREFWQEWFENAENFFAWRDERMTAYEAQLGRHVHYCLFDKDHWPIRIGFSFRTDSQVICMTLGVSTQPMPNIEKYFQDPSPHRRIEFGGVLPPNASDAEINTLFAELNTLTSFPWRSLAPLASGHTINNWHLPKLKGMAHLKFSLLVKAGDVAEIPDLEGWSFRGDPVTRLWVVPITNQERTLAMKTSSSDLLERLNQHGVTAQIECRFCTAKKKLFGWF